MLKENYGTDARGDFFKALRSELHRKPLWMAMRDGIKARGITFRFYFSKPRSAQSVAYQRHVSLDKFRRWFGNRLGTATILYTKDVTVKAGIINLPLYMAGCI